jgi:hypothetical protein
MRHEVLEFCRNEAPAECPDKQLRARNQNGPWYGQTGGKYRLSYKSIYAPASVME